MKRLRIFVTLIIMLFTTSYQLLHTAIAEEHVMPEDVNKIFVRFQKEIDNNSLLSLGFKKIYYNSFVKGFELVFFDKSCSSFKGDFFYSDNVINGTASRSFFVSFSLNYYYEFLLNFVTALITAIDPNLSTADVQFSANELVSSFSGGYSKVLPSRVGFSKIVSVGDYLLIIHSLDDTLSHIFVYHKKDINIPVDKSEYKELSFQEIKSNKYSLQKIYLTGIVEEQLPDTIEMYSQACILFISLGNQYKAFYYPYDLPINFEMGKEYTIYGLVDEKQEGDYASVDVQYVDMENDAH